MITLLFLVLPEQESTIFSRNLAIYIPGNVQNHEISSSGMWLSLRVGLVLDVSVQSGGL